VTFNLQGFTQVDDAQRVSVTTFAGQDGYPQGTLSAASFTNAGEVIAEFTNGNQRVLGVVRVALVPRLNGLATDGDHLLAANATSGTPVVGRAGEGGRGSLVVKALELLPPDRSCSAP
jgi:flagellar hook protein FlgE